MTAPSNPQPQPDAEKRLREALECVWSDDEFCCSDGDHAVFHADLRALLARVEALESAHRALKLGLVEALGPSCEERPVLDAVRRIVAERQALEADKARLTQELAETFVKWLVVKDVELYRDDVHNLRNLPDIPWGIGGKSGAETVAEWRNDLAKRIELYLAARGTEGA